MSKDEVDALCRRWIARAKELRKRLSNPIEPQAYESCAEDLLKMYQASEKSEIIQISTAILINDICRPVKYIITALFDDGTIMYTDDDGSNWHDVNTTFKEEEDG